MCIGYTDDTNVLEM